VWSLDGVDSFKRGQSKQLQRKADGQIEEIIIDLTPSKIELREIDRSPTPTRSHLDEWEDRFNRLIQEQQRRGYKPAAIVFRLATMNPPIEVWKMAEKYLGYRRGWARHKFREQQEAMELAI
jgi:hypothetical protein